MEWSTAFLGVTLNICIPKGMERQQENKLRFLGETSQNYSYDSHLHFNFSAKCVQWTKNPLQVKYFILNPVSDTI